MRCKKEDDIEEECSGYGGESMRICNRSGMSLKMRWAQLVTQSNTNIRQVEQSYTILDKNFYCFRLN